MPGWELNVRGGGGATSGLGKVMVGNNLPVGDLASEFKRFKSQVQKNSV